MQRESTSSTPEASGEELSLRLLGDFQVRVRGETLEGFRSGRARELLSFLVLNPDAAHARQRLAFLFWPGSSEHQARTNLRNVLHQLRRAHPALDASLRVTPTSLQWRPVGPVTVDVERFVAAVDAAVDADPDDVVELIDRCRAAASIYSGDLLEGDHDEWVIPLREALRDQYKDVLTRLAAALVDADRAREAVPVARALVHADSLDESSYRLRIEAHARSGDRPGAVRAYHDCVATLERELGVAPSRATVALYESLIDSPGDVDSSLRDASVSRRHRLVGRDAEWRQIVAAWQAAESGPPAAVFVTGEAGIGKTRLVDELQARCAASGAAIGVARSYPTEGDLGHAVIASWLRSPDIAAGRTHLSETEIGELARVLPELGAPAEMDGADQATRRRRLFDAAAAALTASGRPTLLVADDAQWSDQASHEFIHYAIREGRGTPLLVVLTARTEDIDGCTSLRALRGALAVLDRLTEVSLGRLPIRATGELGSQLIRSDLDEEAVDALFAESEGNPLFVVETIRGGWDGRGGRLGLTPRLRAVIDARFRQLSEPAASVLRSAAVVGRPSSAALLKLVTGLEDRSLVQGLDELWQRGILCETGSDSYEFSHGKLREAAYDRLTPANRRSLHGAVADALVQLGTGDPDSVAGHVAAHLEAANQPDEAVAWLQRAAVDAQQMFAYGEAVRLLDRALALVPSLPPTVRHTRELELLSTLPGVLAGVDGYGTTRMSDAHQRAADVAAGLGVELEPALVRSMVMSALCRDEFSEAAATAARLSARATTDGDPGLAVESHYLLGISAFWSADLDRAREHFEAVVARFDQSMRPLHHTVYGHDPQVVCLSRLANTLWFLGGDDEARAACKSALAMADEVGHPLSHDTAVIFSCVLAVDLGDHDLLRRGTSRLGELGMASLPHTIKRDALLGLVDVLDGRHDEGIARGLAALDSCGGRNFYPGFRATITRVLLAAHAAAADAVGGLSTVKQALAMSSTPLWNAEAHRLQAEFLRQSGADVASVLGALDEAERIARSHSAIGQLRRVHETRERLVARP